MSFSEENMDDHDDETNIKMKNADEFLRQRQNWEYLKHRFEDPYFANHTEGIVYVSVGQTAYLHCLIGNLGDRQVRTLLIHSADPLSSHVSVRLFKIFFFTVGLTMGWPSGSLTTSF